MDDSTVQAGPVSFTRWLGSANPLLHLAGAGCDADREEDSHDQADGPPERPDRIPEPNGIHGGAREYRTTAVAGDRPVERNT